MRKRKKLRVKVGQGDFRPEDNPLKLDKFNLDKEVERQAESYGFWAKRLARTDKDVAHYKANLDLVEARLTLAVRERPSKFGFAAKPPTEKQVASKVLILDEYRDAVTAYNNAVYQRDRVKAVVKGMEHKKSMIEEACYLDARGYFSRPRTPSSHGDSTAGLRRLGRRGDD